MGVLTLDNGAKSAYYNIIEYFIQYESCSTMLSKNKPCLKRNVNKGDTWWIQVVLHQGRHWGYPQTHN